MSAALQELLEPVTHEAFAQRWRDRQPLHVARQDAERFAHLVSQARIERLLSERPISFPDLQLSRFAQPIAPADYTDAAGRIIGPRLLQYHAEGATLVLARVQHYLPALSRLCETLQRQTGLRWQANAYLSPAGQQGFGPHYDAHDVYILQVTGRKRFAFYDGGPELPLSSQRFEPGRWAPAARVQEADLHAGSTLYIPRGVMHDAVADPHQASVHITLGCFAPTLLDVLQGALERCAETDVTLRQAIYRHADAALADAQGWMDQACLDEALERLRDEVALNARPCVQGLAHRLRQAAPAATRTADAMLRLRDGEPWQTRSSGGSLRLRCSGSVLSFDGAAARAVQQLLDERRLPLSRLGMLGDEQRDALVELLVNANIAELERRAPDA